VVPPASGEELTAELDERRAATGPTRAEQETAGAPKISDATRKAVTGSAEVPVAAFSGDTQ
jgi:hypothetical protein